MNERCWRCRGQVVLGPAIIRQFRRLLGEAYEAIPVEGNERILNSLNEMRNILTVSAFHAIEPEELGG